MTLVYEKKQKLLNNVDFVSYIESSIAGKKSYSLQIPDDWDENYVQYVDNYYNNIWNANGAKIKFEGNVVNISCL